MVETAVRRAPGTRRLRNVFLCGAAVFGAAAAGALHPAAGQITSNCSPSAAAENCTINLIDGATLDLLSGDDTVGSGAGGATIGSSGAGILSGGADNDSITLSQSRAGFNAGSTGQILGDSGDDTITILNSTIGYSGSGTVSGGDGLDRLVIGGATSTIGRTAAGVVTGGAGDDTIEISLANLGLFAGSTAQILGDADNDSIVITDSIVGFNGAATVSGGAGLDSISITNASLGLYAGSTGQVIGDAGNDSISIASSAVGRAGAATVSGGDGDDTIAVGPYSNIGFSAGSAGQILGDAGNDSIAISYSAIGRAGDGTVSGGVDNDTITLEGLSVGLLANSTGVVRGNTGNDSITVSGSIVGQFGSGTVTGGDGADTIAITLGSSIGAQSGSTGQVLGDAGDDSISLSAGVVGNAGNATVSGGDGADTIALSGGYVGGLAGSSGQVLGDAGADNISLTSVYVGYSGAATVSGGAGDDAITLSSTPVFTTVIGRNSGSAGQVLGDAGADAITIDGAVIGQAGAGTVDGGADADVIRLINGTSVNGSSSVLGGAGDDTIFIDNSVTFANAATLSGGADSDTLDWTANAAQTSALTPGGFESMVKRGTGNLTLTGASVFVAQTRVEAGTLSLTGAGAVSSAAVNINNTGTLFTDGGALAVASQVNVANGGTFTVGGDEVAASLTNAGTAGISGGNLTGLSTFTNSGFASIAATRTLSSTTAALTGGTLTNAGALTTTGGTTVASGATLNSTGTVSGGLVNNGTTSASGAVQGAVQNASAFTVAGALAGNNTVANTGTFNVTGGDFSGSTSFSNSNALTVSATRTLSTGALNMTAGTLVNNGTIIGAFTQTGGVLSGNGTVQGVFTASGGSITPGSSIGTINVVGAFTLNAGSNLVMEVTNGSADRINVTGPVAINGATLALRDLVGGPALMDPAQSFVLISNDSADAISGSGFASIVDQLAFLVPSVSLTGGDGNDVAVRFTLPSIDLKTAAATQLQANAAGAFNPVVNADNPASQQFFNAFGPLTNAQAAAALQTLAGEAHPVAQDVTAMEALAFADAATQSCDAKERGWCAAADYRRTNFDTDRDAAGGSKIDGDGDSFVGTVGKALAKDFVVGVSFRYGTSDAALGGETIRSKNWGVALSAAHQFDAARLSASLGRLNNSVDVARRVHVGTLAQTAASGYDVNANFAAGEASYAFDLSEKLEVSPFAAIAGAWTKRDAFAEVGAGAANLNAGLDHGSYGYGDLGARATLSKTIGGVALSPELSLAYSRLFGEATPEQVLAFSAGGPSFNAFGAGHERNRMRVGGSLNAGFAPGVTGYVRYDGLFSKSDQDQRFVAGFGVQF